MKNKYKYEENHLGTLTAENLISHQKNDTLHIENNYLHNHEFSSKNMEKEENGTKYLELKEE